MATPIGRIELAANARILLHSDPTLINAPMLLGKSAKLKQPGPDLAKAQLAAWGTFIDAYGNKKKPRAGRR
jgi:hypothetical protein